MHWRKVVRILLLLSIDYCVLKPRIFKILTFVSIVKYFVYTNTVIPVILRNIADMVASQSNVPPNATVVAQRVRPTVHDVAHPNTSTSIMVPTQVVGAIQATAQIGAPVQRIVAGKPIYFSEAESNIYFFVFFFHKEIPLKQYWCLLHVRVIGSFGFD